MSPNKTIILKKMMAIAGLIWLLYIIFHLFSIFTFHLGEQSYNSFHLWLRDSWFYVVLLSLLAITFVFHIYVAITRQIKNNKSNDGKYKKPYPKAIPRIVVWSGASLIFLFIVVHSVQMLAIETKDLYAETLAILSNPFMLILYGLGILAIFAHLQHGLSNVLNTLALSSKKYSKISFIIMFLIILAYVSVIFVIIL